MHRGCLWIGLVFFGFGAASAADTIATVASVASAAASMSPRTYLDQAIADIRQAAMNADRVDWDTLIPKLHAMAQGARTTADTYPAIDAALAALDDHHSLLARPALVRQSTRSTTTDDFGQSSRMLGRAGYLAVPGYLGMTSVRNTAFADEMQQRLSDLRAAKACGYLVDLRRDSGGNMFPMLAGLAPLLGDGKLGSFVSRTESRDWRSNAGSVRDQWNEVRPAHSHVVGGGARAPVAMLVGPGTASSGESVLVSFIGRPGTRSFGQPSAGLSTSNNFMPLPDGAGLAVTTAVLADRTGKTYGGPIPPDETIAPGTDGGRLEDDPVVIAARRWLMAQPACMAAAD